MWLELNGQCGVTALFLVDMERQHVSADVSTEKWKISDASGKILMPEDARTG